MNCKKIKELLVTDYLDNQADEKIMSEVKKHLEGCDGCRRFEQEVRISAVEPFKHSLEPKVPYSVWLNIRDRLLQRQNRKVSILDVVVERLKAFYVPKPALTFATAGLIFIITIGALVKHNADKVQVRNYFADQVYFYSQITNNEEIAGEYNF